MTYYNSWGSNLYLHLCDKVGNIDANRGYYPDYYNMSQFFINSLNVPQVKWLVILPSQYCTLRLQYQQTTNDGQMWYDSGAFLDPLYPKDLDRGPLYGQCCRDRLYFVLAGL